MMMRLKGLFSHFIITHQQLSSCNTVEWIGMKWEDQMDDDDDKRWTTKYSQPD